jgi:hypothetical protein
LGTGWACGSSGGNGSTFKDDGGADVLQTDATTDDGGADVEQFAQHEAGEAGMGMVEASAFSDAPADLSITPSGPQTITVTVGQTPPTQMFTALLNGVPVNAAWGVDRGNVGVVPGGPSQSVTFTPSGTTGGLVTITAGFNGHTATAQVFVKLVASQSGASMSAAEQNQVAMTVGQLTSGGGVGGVGGEGLGVPVTDMPTLQALQNPASDGSAQGFALLYPYDKTVWPRGILAPLLQWTGTFPGGGAGVDAIQVTLATTSGSFSWTGTFGPPTILGQTKGPFIRMPIPQDIWTIATNTAGGVTPNNMPDQLLLSLTVAKGGMGYGPIKETWPVAPGRLSGIIYYNSYGTQLAKNYGGAVGGDKTFGGAVLSIHVGDSGPKLVAGGSGSTDGSQCRVCHSVAAQGSRLAVNQYNGGPENITSAYDLTPTGAVEHVLTHNSPFPAMFPTGSMLLNEQAQLLPLPADTKPIMTTGLTTVATDLGTPAFSPDGTLVAMNPMTGPGVTAPAQEVLVMSFDSKTSTFGSPVVVVDDTGKPADTRPGWPAFFPDGKSLVFQHQSKAGSDPPIGALYTREGDLSQIAWTNATDSQHVTVLGALNGQDANGKATIPSFPGGTQMNCTGNGIQVGNIDPKHANDINTNYEPTVNPLPTGGYVWVVFTSRRMYGSAATIPPFCSDPRGVDLVQNTTTKKLWVSAVDLSAAPGTDASHPAFYLPGQELLAGNARGFWVLDPCLADGSTCTAGDQCCNGYCEPGGDGGALVCSNTPPNSKCSAVNDKCSTAADCCDTTNKCINGFCAQSSPTSGTGGAQ